MTAALARPSDARRQRTIKFALALASLDQIRLTAHRGRAPPPALRGIRATPMNGLCLSNVGQTDRLQQITESGRHTLLGS